MQKPAADESQQCIAKGIHYTQSWNRKKAPVNSSNSHMSDLITIISKMIQRIWKITLMMREGGERRPHPEHNLRFFLQAETQYTLELLTRMLCQRLSLSFHLLLINSLLFPICNTSLTDWPGAVALPQWESEWDQGSKVKGSTFSLSSLNGGHGNSNVIYAWGHGTPIC